jgi:spore germination protein GerM
MVTSFVPFKATLSFTPSTTARGTLVLKKDNPSGLPENEDEFRIPVTFKTTASAENTMVVKVFFGNRNLDPEGFSCGATYSTDRRIPKTSTPARAALEQLLEGPTNAEAEQEYFTSINSGVKIQSLTIENGVAKVDFNATIEEAVAGSCRVGAIRSQITNTLMQFSTVKSIVISVNGRTQDILQP